MHLGITRSKRQVEYPGIKCTKQVNNQMCRASKLHRYQQYKCQEQWSIPIPCTRPVRKPHHQSSGIEDRWNAPLSSSVQGRWNYPLLSGVQDTWNASRSTSDQSSGIQDRWNAPLSSSVQGRWNYPLLSAVQDTWNASRSTSIQDWRSAPQRVHFGCLLLVCPLLCFFPLFVVVFLLLADEGTKCRKRSFVFFSSFVIHWWVHFPSSFPRVYSHKSMSCYQVNMYDCGRRTWLYRRIWCPPQLHTSLHMMSTTTSHITAYDVHHNFTQYHTIYLPR